MKIEHLGIAVRRIDPALKLFSQVLGGKIVHRETVAPMKLDVCTIELGGILIELLEPREGEETISTFISRRGEGFHHVAYAVPDIASAQSDLLAQGYRPIWDKPRLGSRRKLVTFLHPRDTHGVLIELIASSDP